MSWNFSVKNIIKNKISELQTIYQRNQGIILTESDLKSLIYKKLLEIPILSKYLPTEDRYIYANSVHTELPWYDRHHKLTIRPDITILDPKYLSILHRYGFDFSQKSLPSKGCSFEGNAIIFELKFIRTKSGITQRRVTGPLMNDYRKIKSLFDRLDTQRYPWHVFCYFVVFNKTNKKCKEFDDFFREINRNMRCEIIYVTGNVHFRQRPL